MPLQDNPSSGPEGPAFKCKLCAWLTGLWGSFQFAGQDTAGWNYFRQCLPCKPAQLKQKCICFSVAYVLPVHKCPSIYYCWETRIYTFLTPLYFWGGGEGKLVLSVLDIRTNNRTVVYSKSIKPVCIHCSFFTTQRHETDASPHKSLVPRNNWKQQLTHPHQPPPAEHASHCLGNECKQQTNFRSWHQIPFLPVQSRNHSSVWDICVPALWNKQQADALGCLWDGGKRSSRTSSKPWTLGLL